MHTLLTAAFIRGVGLAKIKNKTALQKAKAELAKRMREEVRAAVAELGPETAALVEAYRKKTDSTCDSCGRKASTLLCRDHNHHSGKFRGLLCVPCNLALGLLKDDVDRVECLAAYLRRPPPLRDIDMIKFDD